MRTADPHNQTTFTTTQAANVCDVSVGLVKKWLTSGKLRGYRLPGSQDWRIPRAELIVFLKDNGMGSLLYKLGEECLVAEGVAR